MSPELNKITNREKLVRISAAALVSGTALFSGQLDHDTIQNEYSALPSKHELILSEDDLKIGFNTALQDMIAHPKEGPNPPSELEIGHEISLGYAKSVEENEEAARERVARVVIPNRTDVITSQSVLENGKAENLGDAKEIVKIMYTLESSNGKYDSCKEQGKFNGYGYGQNNSEWRCYDSFEEVTARVTEWVQDKIDRGFSTAQIFCFYQTGTLTADCTNYQKYLGMK